MGRRTPTIFDIWQIYYSYTDPNGQTWYGERCHFVNSPIPFNAPFSLVAHIIVGNAHAQLPTNALIIGDDLRRKKLFGEWYKCKVHCRWHIFCSFLASIEKVSVPCV